MKGSSHLTDYAPPGGRVCPPEVVVLVREIDPRAEIIYVGRGKWMLGTVKPDRIRYAQAVRAVGAYFSVLTRWDRGEVQLGPRQRAELRMRLWKKLLQLQGWREVCLFTQPVPDSAIAEIFRRATWMFHNRFREIEREAERQADGTADLEEREAAAQHYVDQEFRSIHKHVFRGRRGLVSPGLPGAETRSTEEIVRGHTHNESRSAAT